MDDTRQEIRALRRELAELRAEVMAQAERRERFWSTCGQAALALVVLWRLQVSVVEGVVSSWVLTLVIVVLALDARARWAATSRRRRAHWRQRRSEVAPR